VFAPAMLGQALFTPHIHTPPHVKSKVRNESYFFSLSIPPFPFHTEEDILSCYRGGPCYQLNLKQIFLTLENKVSDTKHCKIIMSYVYFPFTTGSIVKKWKDLF